MPDVWSVAWSGRRFAASWCVAALLSFLRPAWADSPTIAYVTQPVRHWETFFLFGEGFEAKDVRCSAGWSATLARPTSWPQPSPRRDVRASA